MDNTFAQRLHKYELVLRGFYLKALRLQIKPYKDFFISHGYLGQPSDLIKPRALEGAYIDSYRYISDADSYSEWKRQNYDFKKRQKDFTIDDGYLVISETLKAFFLQAALSNYNNVRDDLTQTTIDSINAFVAKARAAGNSDADIAAALSNVYEDTSRTRAGVIAATEAHAIMSLVKRHTAMQFFKQKGVQGYRYWITRRDERVRHTHVEAEGQTIPVEAKYVLNMRHGGTETADYPGDPFLTPENRVYCRCMEDYTTDPNGPNKKGDD